MPKKNALQPPETLPVVDSVPEVVTPAPKKKVVARKKAPAVKKSVVMSEAAPEVVAPVVVAPIVEPKPEVMPEPEPVAAPKHVAPRAMAPRPRPVMPPPIRQTKTEVETKTKTDVVVGLAAAGALMLAAAAALLALRSDNQLMKLQRVFATLPTTLATTPWRPRIIPRFIISLSDVVKPLPSADIVGDNSTEYPVAAFSVRTEAGSWLLTKFRAEVVGHAAVKNIVVRDEKGREVKGTWVMTSKAGQFDVTLKETFPADTTKIYKVFVKVSTTSANVPLKVSILNDGLDMRSDAGQIVTSLPAVLSGPAWRVVPKKK